MKIKYPEGVLNNIGDFYKVCDINIIINIIYILF